MEYIKHTIDELKNKNVLVISFSGMTPHLEASIEIAIRLNKQNKVSFVHLGQFVSRPSVSSTAWLKRKFQLPIRAIKAEKYIKHNSNNQIRIINKLSLAKEVDNQFKERVIAGFIYRQLGCTSI